MNLFDFFHRISWREPKFATLQLQFWGIDFKLFIEEQNSERTFDLLPFPAQEIQIEKPASHRKSLDAFLSLTWIKDGK